MGASLLALAKSIYFDFGLFWFMGVSTTHPILSMLLTHTTSGPPVKLANFGLKVGPF